MKFVRLLVLLLFGLVVFGVTMPFAGLIPPLATLLVRGALLALFGGLWLTARPDAPFKPIYFAYCAIIVGLTVAHYGVDPIMRYLQLGYTPVSHAVAKAVGAALVSLPIIVLALVAKQSLGSLYLSAGRVLFGIGFGLAGFCAMAVVTFIPGGPFFKPGVLDIGLVLAVAPWVLLFVLTNAFMEELLFRGVLLQRYEALVGSQWALIVTTLVFALAHVRVDYTAQILGFVAFVFGVGYLWGLLMQKSKSIWGSVLFHAGADVAIILPMYQAMMQQ